MQKPSMKSDAKSRRAKVMEKLQIQLKAGTKVLPDGSGTMDLSESDITRIQKELETLKTRI